MGSQGGIVEFHYQGTYCSVTRLFPILRGDTFSAVVQYGCPLLRASLAAQQPTHSGQAFGSTCSRDNRTCAVVGCLVLLQAVLEAQQPWPRLLTDCVNHACKASIDAPLSANQTTYCYSNARWSVARRLAGRLMLRLAYSPAIPSKDSCGPT